MPSQYDALVAALKTTEIPFAEYGWETRPAGMHGIVAIDFESSFLNGDGLKQDRVWEGSVDVFFTALDDRNSIVSAVEEKLAEVCGCSWELNSTTYEHETGLFHFEWVFEVQDEDLNED